MVTGFTDTPRATWSPGGSWGPAEGEGSLPVCGSGIVLLRSPASCCLQAGAPGNLVVWLQCEPEGLTPKELTVGTQSQGRRPVSQPGADGLRGVTWSHAHGEASACHSPPLQTLVSSRGPSQTPPKTARPQLLGVLGWPGGHTDLTCAGVMFLGPGQPWWGSFQKWRLLHAPHISPRGSWYPKPASLLLARLPGMLPMSVPLNQGPRPARCLQQERAKQSHMRRREGSGLSLKSEHPPMRLESWEAKSEHSGKV
ncbi:PREDICTED: uncharacterized protein LOC105575588 [Cercocebus atys]|uniref:uncharacterized protein LOC105575588 n=1 Tax=Cercocebus atys TaxID=9531 RepID=UPI0005F3EC82|nr:PREDICTED: uncharacterized protein LOC105575588 [Cercocebus atys]